jgi:hypothetical protein
VHACTKEVKVKFETVETSVHVPFGVSGGQSPLVEKKGFNSSLLVPKLFGPRLNGALVLVQLKMWAREH